MLSPEHILLRVFGRLVVTTFETNIKEKGEEAFFAS
jgi:hypothetical protein